MFVEKMKTIDLCIKRNALKREKHIHSINCEGDLPESTQSGYDIAIAMYQDEIDRREQEGIS